MNLKGNSAPEARGAKPFQHSNIYYDTFFSQNAAVAIFQKGLSQKCGKCGNFFIKCEQNFENVGPLGTLLTSSPYTEMPLMFGEKIGKQEINIPAINCPSLPTQTYLGLPHLNCH